MSAAEELLDNPKAQRIKRIIELQSAKGRKKHHKTLVEAPQAVREMLQYMPERVQDVYYCLQTLSTHSVQRVQELVSQAKAQHCYVHEVSPRVMDAMSTDAQGILAVVDTDQWVMDSAAFEQLPSEYNQRGFLAAFWQIRDPGNAGTVIRSADAAGCSAVVFVDDCVDPLSPKVIRASVGSTMHLPLVHMSIEELQAYSMRHQSALFAADVYGSEHNPAVLLNNAVTQYKDLNQALVMVFGNEARGLDNAIIEQCTGVLTIPMYGKTESMNLASSAAIILHSIAMARHS